MTIFEIEDNRSVFRKVWNEMYLLLCFSLGLALPDFTFFKRHYLIIGVVVFLLFLYKLFNPRNRHVFGIELDDKNNILCICCYQFVFFEYRQEISYELLQISYKHKLYGRGRIPKTLEFRKEDRLVAEIKEKYNLGWTNEEIESIYEALKKRIF
ncbi:hypothetical protein EYV94_28110 [Puteibacter caeruleilacunae]|nr:hypothetical protein EYV94_28110 [Puteibacter caeruleilacunae]